MSWWSFEFSSSDGGSSGCSANFVRSDANRPIEEHHLCPSHRNRTSDIRPKPLQLQTLRPRKLARAISLRGSIFGFKPPLATRLPGPGSFAVQRLMAHCGRAVTSISLKRRRVPPAACALCPKTRRCNATIRAMEEKPHCSGSSFATDAGGSCDYAAQRLATARAVCPRRKKSDPDGPCGRPHR